ncbi:hypothetical protein BFW01_g12013 [Lasiodiplodia theobromae]|nr:hypothetical protein BFW01_g12013 [Lasiodiplodia theobromae]
MNDGTCQLCQFPPTCLRAKFSLQTPQIQKQPLPTRRYGAPLEDIPHEDKMAPKMDAKEWVRFKCQHCVLTFKSEEERDDHEKSHTQPKRFPCPYEACSSRFNTSSELSRHLALHQPEQKHFKCPVCKKGYERKHKLGEHVRARYAIDVPLDLSVDELVELVKDVTWRFGCPSCDRRFATKEGLEKHFSKMHDNDYTTGTTQTRRQRSRGVHGNIICTICQGKFLKVEYLRTHLINVHHRKYEEASALASNSGAAAAGKQPTLEKTQCPQCGRVFANQGYLKNHLRSYHNKSMEEAFGIVESQALLPTDQPDQAPSPTKQPDQAPSPTNLPDQEAFTRDEETGLYSTMAAREESVQPPQATSKSSSSRQSSTSSTTEKCGRCIQMEFDACQRSMR